MAVKARGEITLIAVVDVYAVFRYYKLQSSTLDAPEKPAARPPAGWTDTEPAYTEGSTNSLYTVDLTVFSDGTWAYSEVSLSSSYEAAKLAYNKAAAAESGLGALEENTNAEFSAVRQDIIDSATNVSSGTQSYTDTLVDGLEEKIATMYVARVEGEEGTVAELKEFISSTIASTSSAWEARFEATAQAVVDVDNDLVEYQEMIATFIRLGINGIIIGREEGGESAPYTVVISNEKMSFQYMGHEVAYIQYNKLYITSAEVVDRMSIGSEANGGFFDFITTATGMGLKWRGA